MVFVMSFPIDSIAKLLGLSSEIVECRYVLISLNFEKILSHECRAHMDGLTYLLKSGSS